MHDFKARRADMMHNEILAGRMISLKSSETEVSKMCESVENYAKKYAQEYAAKQMIGMLGELIKDGVLTVADAAKRAGMTEAAFRKAAML